MSKHRPRIWWVGAGLVILGVVGIGFAGWYKLLRAEPQPVFTGAEESYKYGSIGADAAEGLPYWVWVVLPSVFPDRLPGGYDALGIVWEPGHETPVGFSKRTIGFPRIAINCAACHMATYRTAADAPEQIVPTGPSQRFDLQAYVRFLAGCAQDPRFGADTLLPAIEQKTRLSWLDKLLYRYLIIPQTQRGLLDLGKRFVWTTTRPPWGPGRIDPFNPVKFNPRLLALDPTQDPSIGNSDVMPIWNMQGQAGFALHWDGMNDSLREIVLAGALGDGATKRSLPVAALDQLTEYLKTKTAPPYPFLDTVNQSLAAQGKAIFQQHCAVCHAPNGAHTGQMIPIAEIGTDANRLAMWTSEAAQRYNDYTKGYEWDFSHFVDQEGYVAKPLDGVWLRAPYLHNGSVPTLEALLQPAAQRPKLFYRGYDVYDRDQIGFISQGRDAEAYGFRYDTAVAGNGNGGHEGATYGTTLTPSEKQALIEYLKTL